MAAEVQQQNWFRILRASQILLLPELQKLTEQFELRVFGSGATADQKSLEWQNLRNESRLARQPRSDEVLRPQKLPNNFFRQDRLRDVTWYTSLFYLWSDAVQFDTQVFQLAHDGTLCRPQDLVSPALRGGLEAGRELRNYTFHPDAVEGQTSEVFSQRKKQLGEALATMTGSHVADQIQRVAESCKVDVSPAGLQQALNAVHTHNQMEALVNSGFQQAGQDHQLFQQHLDVSFAQLAAIVQDTAKLDQTALKVYAFGLVYAVMKSHEDMVLQSASQSNRTILKIAQCALQQSLSLPVPDLQSMQDMLRLRQSRTWGQLEVYVYLEGCTQLGLDLQEVASAVMTGPQSWSRVASCLLGTQPPFPPQDQIIHLAHEQLAAKGVFMIEYLIKQLFADFK